jgi:asparagine synthase (glutamine-hydrolysing)
MSGYFAIVRTDGASVEPGFLERIAHSLAFRGPDGSHTESKDAAGFSFAFLDLGAHRQARLQPVRLGEHWLVGEVRLDGRRELIAELNEKDQLATSESSDEELVLLAWRVWGEACLQKFLGDFSFGLWDAEKQSLCCARDFAGAKPLFYAQFPGAICFTNTLQAFEEVTDSAPRSLRPLAGLSSRCPCGALWRTRAGRSFPSFAS